MEELARARRIRDLSQPDSAFFRGADALLCGVRESVRKAKKMQSEGAVVKIPYQLLGEDLRRLSAEFGCELSVNPRETAVSPFAQSKMFLASRLNAQIKSWQGEEVIFVDGDITTVAAKHQTWIHVCRSHCTNEVLASEVLQTTVLARMCESLNLDTRVRATSLLHEIEKGGGPSICLNARNCRATGDTVLVELHRTSVNSRQAVALMSAHSASRVKLWFFFETAMLTQEEGDLTSMKGCFVVDKARDMVSIIPEGAREPCAVYTYSVLCEYVSTAYVEYESRACTVEVHDNVPGVFFVIVADAGMRRDFDTGLERRIFYPAGTSMTIVTQKMYVSTVVSGQSAVQEVSIRVPKTMWEKVYSRMMTVSDDAHGMATARTAVFDASSQEVAMGTFVRAPKGLPFDVPEVFARAVCKLTAIERVNMSMESASAKGYVNLLQQSGLSVVASCVAKLLIDGVANMSAALLKLPTFIGLQDSSIDYSVRVESGVDSTLIVGKSGYGCSGFVPYLPGGQWAQHKTYSDTGSERLRVINTAMYYSQAMDEFNAAATGSSVFTEETFESFVTSNSRVLEPMREELVDKLVDLSGADGVRSVMKVREEYNVTSEPELSVEVPVADAVGVLADVVSEQLPSVGGLHAENRQYLVADADKFSAYESSLLKLNQSKLGEIREVRVRKSVLGTACEGKRVATQDNAVMAFSGRVANAPNMAGEIDFESRLISDFSAFESVCLKEGWRERIATACENGMWNLDVPEARKYVAKMATSNVAKAIAEDFRVGNIDLTRWVAMVKSVPKAKLTEEGATKIVVPQTIVYQDSKMTNSLFSAQTSKALDFIDQEFLPYIRLNARRDEIDDERWVNSMRGRYAKYSDSIWVESDISQCDKSQSSYNLALFFYILEQFGAPKDLTDLWKVMIGAKVASAKDVGMLIEYVLQNISGSWLTIAINTYVCAVANIVSMRVTREQVVSGEVRGDDCLWRLTDVPKLTDSNENFSRMFNMEAKVFVVDVPYFCSKYYVRVEGHWFLVRDPLKTIVSLGRPLSASVSVEESWDSFRDRMKHYDKSEVLDALDVAYCLRNKTSNSIRHGLRALYSLSQSIGEYRKLYEKDICKLG